MKNIVIAVVFVVGAFLMGTIEKNVGFGAIMAVFTAAIMTHIISHEKKAQEKARKMAQEPPQAEQAKPAKAGNALYWICGIFLAIILTMAGVPVIPLIVGAVLLIAVIQAIPGMRRKQKQQTEEFLEDYRRELRQDMQAYKHKKAREEEERKAARAEAEHLEDLARLWERNAKKYGAASDIRKAKDFREQANAAWRKIR